MYTLEEARKFLKDVSSGEKDLNEIEVLDVTCYLLNLLDSVNTRVALLEKARQAAVDYLADKGPCFKKMYEDDPDCGFENCLNCALEKAVKEASAETTP